ncbi:MAG: M56 family metallopeptidase, partial [Acidobacteriota bacterium]
MTPWSQFADAALLAALNSLWQSAGIACVVALAFRLRKGIDAATRHAVWWAALAAIVTLPFLPARPAPVARPATRPALQAPSTNPPALLPPLPSARQPHEVRAGALPSLVMAGWILLSALLLGRLFRSGLRLRGLIGRCALPPEYAARRFGLWRNGRRATLLVSDEIASPMACSFLPPVVVLPGSLLGKISEAELDHILLHELAHVARRDQWTNLLARVTGALFALHPVAAWVLRNIERERELACDEWVVATTGAPRPYAATLARLFELCRGRRREMLATGMAQKTSRLGERIETLVAATYSARHRVSWVRLAIAVTVLLL